MKKNLFLIALLAGLKITFAQAGNVGINTTTPANTLTVNGNASVGSSYSNIPAPADGLIIEGRTGIGTSSPFNMLHVQASTDISQPSASNIVARFDPMGGSDLTRDASIIINGGRTILGYSKDGNKYAFLRGNQATDIRLQVSDANANLLSDTFVISAASGTTGFVGLNTANPQARLDVRGNIKALAGTGTQTGAVWNGTSNFNGFEAFTTASGDAWVGIQRSGTGATLHLSKPVGSTDGSMVHFDINGVGIGSITHSATGIAYNTTSDMRLKENIRPSQFGLSTLKKIGIYDYNYKADEKKALSTGVLAQELYKIYPQAVTPGGNDEKASPWQVDYSKLIPVLIKSAQELQAEYEQLEAQVKKLENKI